MYHTTEVEITQKNRKGKIDQFTITGDFTIVSLLLTEQVDGI